MSSDLVTSIMSALLNMVILGAIAFGILAFWRRGRPGGSGSTGAAYGLALGDAHYVAVAAALAVVVAIALMVLPIDYRSIAAPGTAQHGFLGRGPTPATVLLALIYGLVKTGFPEELLFRGVIVAALRDRWKPAPVNLIQATIFLLPHAALLFFTNVSILLLALIFGGALVLGWLRLKSGSILGPVLIHATANVTTCLLVAMVPK